MSDRLLEVARLTVAYRGDPVVGPVSFTVGGGEVVALLGASGSGKSSIGLALMGLLPDTASTDGMAKLGDVDLLRMDRRTRRAVLGRRIGYVAQDAGGWLNPVQRVGDQVAEAVMAHQRMSKSDCDARVFELLRSVGLANDGARASAYPHELSGGMRQRVAIAMALANDPELVIADEPTSALDAAMQAEVMSIFRARVDAGAGVLLVTHDRSVVQATADRAVEIREPEADNRLAYIVPPAPRPYAPIVLRGSGLKKSFGRQVAVDRVDIGVRVGETVALVGASGSGKSTLARLLTGLSVPDAGWAQFHDRRVDHLKRSSARAVRRRLQYVSQDAYAWLDPRRTVADAVSEPLRVHGIWDKETGPERVQAALELVHLDPSLAGRRPSQLSGGQRARAALARALVLEPEVVVLDEPLAAVDWELREALLRTLTGLQARSGIACVLVSHDLRSVAAVAHRTAVVHEGRIVEEGPTAQLLHTPHHPHTKALVAATALPGPPRPHQGA